MDSSARLMVVEDDPDVQTALSLLLKRHVAEVIRCDEPARIPQLLSHNEPDVILLDMNFGPGESSGQQGLHWLGRILQLNPQAVVVMITAHAGVSTAVEAMKKGATDFVVKPWQNEKLLATLSAAYKVRQSQQEVSQLRAQKKTALQGMTPASQPILGTSSALNNVLTLVQRAAPTSANVLILGENGTGKELVAREIHQLSERSDEVFVSVDLGAVNESLFDSELFGHKRGAFTDARQDRVGRLAAASGGTLFLDEVGNLPLHLQAKLLTVLEQRRVTPVGSNDSEAIDIRLIAATNLSRAQLADETVFRQDLLYRINTVEVEMPPLRDRGEDIPILLSHYLQLYERKYKKPHKDLAPDASSRLQQYHWPGNIRALRHAVERAVILSSEDEYQLADFSLPTDFQSQTHAVATASADVTAPQQELKLRQIERAAIEQALRRHGYNISHAAKGLGLTRAALYRRMKKYDL